MKALNNQSTQKNISARKFPTKQNLSGLNTNRKDKPNVLSNINIHEKYSRKKNQNRIIPEMVDIIEEPQQEILSTIHSLPMMDSIGLNVQRFYQKYSEKSKSQNLSLKKEADERNTKPSFKSSPMKDLSESLLKEQINEAIPDFAAMRKKNDLKLNRRESQLQKSSTNFKNCQGNFIEQLKKKLQEKTQQIEELQNQMVSTSEKKAKENKYPEKSQSNAVIDGEYLSESSVLYLDCTLSKCDNSFQQKERSPESIGVGTHYEQLESSTFDYHGSNSDVGNFNHGDDDSLCLYQNLN